MNGTGGTTVQNDEGHNSFGIQNHTSQDANATTETSVLDGASLLSSSQASIIDFVTRSHSTVLNWWWSDTEPFAEVDTIPCGPFAGADEIGTVSDNGDVVPAPTTNNAQDDSSIPNNKSHSGSIHENQRDNQQGLVSDRHPKSGSEWSQEQRPSFQGAIKSDTVDKGALEYRSKVTGILYTEQLELQREASSARDANPPQPKPLLHRIKDPNQFLVRYESGGSKLTKATSRSTATSGSSSSTGSSSGESEDLPEEPEVLKSPSTNIFWKEKWAQFVGRMGDVIASFITACALVAARNPFTCVTSSVLIAIILLVAGYFTNFRLVVDNTELWPPKKSFSYRQAMWYYESEFNYDYRNVDLVIHANGGNVLTRNGVEHVFKAMGVIQGMEDYQEGCQLAELIGDTYQIGQCHVHSITDFWNQSIALFEQETLSDDQVRQTLLATTYPNGEAVDLARVLGNAQKDENGTLLQAQSFLVEFDLPWSDQTIEFELRALDALLDLKEQWKSDEENPFVIEVTAFRSYEDEFMRAIVLDLPLLPAVFAVVCIFCCVVFWRNDKVQSRCLLGIGAVVCTLLAIMASHGLLFLCGVPFTTSTTMLPFLMFGIGLDDAFIIIGSYVRTSGTNIEKRIELTMKEISLSIFLTSFTSALAFAIGISSNIPSVKWLCLYACPSIVIDFAYQITFFISLLALDERRIQANRMDCCCCILVRENEEEEEGCKPANVVDHIPASEDAVRLPPLEMHEMHWSDRCMAWYADKLLHPISQLLVMVAFFVLLFVSVYFTAQMTQEFDMNDMVPHDSYLRGYYSSLKQFSKTRNGIASYVFFRDVDQSQPEVQFQMLQFVDDLAEKGAIASHPANFWLPDFLHFVNETTSLSNNSFNDQVESFLNVPLYRTLYHDHIVRDSNGTITDSRCEIYINVDISDAKAGIKQLNSLKEIASSQPANEGLDGPEWTMFTYNDMYNLWEFYMRVVYELTVSTIIGVFAVSAVALLFIPHWTAALFVTPLIIVLYVELLGYIRYANVNVNAISYVQLVMSIGLMVDFIIHILIRYYECEGLRRHRVRETLITMGSSVLVGGLSTLLGVVLLAFSTSEVLQLVFRSVLGIIVLGLLHGLIFLPVILSLIGPQ